MTVGELKLILGYIKDDTEIVITSTDPTDYTYINDIVSVQEGFVIGKDEQYISDKDDFDGSGRPVLVIDGGNV